MRNDYKQRTPVRYAKGGVVKAPKPAPTPMKKGGMVYKKSGKC